jgi:hypothetical protein
MRADNPVRVASPGRWASDPAARGADPLPIASPVKCGNRGTCGASSDESAALIKASRLMSKAENPYGFHPLAYWAMALISMALPLGLLFESRGWR